MAPSLSQMFSQKKTDYTYISFQLVYLSLANSNLSAEHEIRASAYIKNIAASSDSNVISINDLMKRFGLNEQLVS